MQPLELLFFALFFLGLSPGAPAGSDLDFLGKLRIWTWLEFVLFVVFPVLVFTLAKGFLTLFGRSTCSRWGWRSASPSACAIQRMP